MLTSSLIRLYTMQVMIAIMIASAMKEPTAMPAIAPILRSKPVDEKQKRHGNHLQYRVEYIHFPYGNVSP